MYPEQIFELILNDLRGVVPFDGATVLARRNGRLGVVCAVGWSNPAELAGLNDDLAWHQTCDTCVEQTRPVLVEDVGGRSYLQLEPLPGLNQGTWLGLPIRLAGRVVGWLGLAFLSRQAVATELAAGLFHVVELPGTPVRRTFYVVRHRSVTPSTAARAFLELVNQRDR